MEEKEIILRLTEATVKLSIAYMEKGVANSTEIAKKEVENILNHFSGETITK